MKHTTVIAGSLCALRVTRPKGATRSALFESCRGRDANLLRSALRVFATRNLIILALLFALCMTACGGDDPPVCAHQWSDWTNNTATCIAAGTEESACTLCGETQSRSTPALGHSFDDNWNVTEAPAAETDGEEERVCARPGCAYAETRTLYATGTSGLVYERINGNAYRVGKGTVTTGEVFIPAKWRGSGTAYSDYLPVTEIGGTDDTTDSAFSNTSIIAVRGCANITAIGDFAFSRCYQLAAISLPSATVIGDAAFRLCYALTTVNLPSATVIGNSAFSDCAALAEANLPLTETIGTFAFSDCAALAELNLPLAETIGVTAFTACAALTNVSLPNATSIGADAFYNCIALAEVSLPWPKPSVGAPSKKPRLSL